MESFADPLMPATHRFPRVASVVAESDQPASDRRPFVLRQVQRPPLVEFKHRTAARPTRIPSKTHRDNRVDDDAYTVPDD